MKKYFTVIAIIFGTLVTTKSFAQSLIAVENNGVTTFYTDLPTYAAAAQNGDNIYLPGGTFTLSAAVTINATVNIYGVGYTVGSTLATGPTIIDCNSYPLTLGGSGITITGVWFNNSGLGIGGTNLVIKRCSLGDLTIGQISNSILVSECVCNSINVDYVDNVTVKNSIINQGIVYAVPSTIFNNNIFLYQVSSTINTSTGGTFQNNVFLNSTISYNSTNLQLYNNIFANVQTASNVLGTSINQSGIYNIGTSSIFQSYAGNGYSEQDNYQLQSTCSGKNAGTDGTDIGIYGTSTPFKTGAIPITPNISSKQINSQTDGSGNLQINVTVNAQTN